MRSVSFTDAQGNSQKAPVPWDPAFRTTWEQFVRAMGQHLTLQPSIDLALSYVRITGINAVSEETSLPDPSNSAWIADGYSDQTLVNTWSEFAHTFAGVFPRQQLDVAVVPQGFPGSNNAPLLTTLINTGIQAFNTIPGYQRFMVQNNALSDFYIDPFVERWSTQTPTGYQMLWFVTGDATYKMNHGTPISAVAELQNAVDRGISGDCTGDTGNAKFLEIYDQDILNPSLAAVVASAHARLDGSFHVATRSSVTAGTAIALTITAEQLGTTNTRFTGYHGAVHIFSTDLAATLQLPSGTTVTLPYDYTFTPGDNGQRTFTVTFHTPGQRSVSVSDTVASQIGGSASITVTPGRTGPAGSGSRTSLVAATDGATVVDTNGVSGVTGPDRSASHLADAAMITASADAIAGWQKEPVLDTYHAGIQYREEGVPGLTEEESLLILVALGA